MDVGPRDFGRTLTRYYIREHGVSKFAGSPVDTNKEYMDYLSVPVVMEI